MNEIGVSLPACPRILIVDDQMGIHSDFDRILTPDGATSDQRAGESEIEAKLFGSSHPEKHVEIFELQHATQGRQAVVMVEAAIAAERPFSVAFIDMRMPPGWDGLKTIQKIWQVDCNVEIVICSAYSDHSRAELAQRLGRTDRFLILNKPFDPAEVIQLASSLSEKWRLARQTALIMSRLETAVDDLRSTNNELERVGYIASHHLQEPLRKISMACDLLTRDYADQLSAEARPWFDSVVDAAAQARTLIVDLRAYSRARTLSVRSQRFSLADVAEVAIADLDEEIAASGGRIEVGTLPEIEGDASLWGGVLRRLLENALRFAGPKPPEVELVAEAGDAAAGEICQIAIRDNGIEIPARYLESVFTLFYRLHSHSDYPGSGAGLTVCRRVLSRQGCRIWLESEVGSGTTVRIGIPATVPAVEAAENPDRQWLDASSAAGSDSQSGSGSDSEIKPGGKR